ncbi:class I SAM-dependent methyltransferase [Clostridium tyrobutyricum]|uniref:tRNA (adenine(22)-N(1))-methyltransferase n=1 Tax=Clostridium tyrobutyricum TaxID=1519 RepID=UPI001C381BF3|nr:class I SAM-dependent methyltransferase [Clostridium tyrobutyricum]MBV4419357.1 class I SAM-dependent methyltransferase [Clostridium tyrobutyricum]
MQLSSRLKAICNMVNNCDCAADIGTDHGYIPIYLVKNNICNRAIASDINKGPIRKAEINIRNEELQNKIECRLGSGLNTIKPGEVQEIIIAGMGGNLIRDIIDENISIFKSVNTLILQPVQNPEVLREYIYIMGFTIVDEELCIDENIFYEIIKVKYDKNKRNIDTIFYEVGERLIEKKHPLVNRFINKKIDKYRTILNYIKENGNLAKKRKINIENKILRLQELIECL